MYFLITRESWTVVIENLKTYKPKILLSGPLEKSSWPLVYKWLIITTEILINLSVMSTKSYSFWFYHIGLALTIFLAGSLMKANLANKSISPCWTEGEHWSWWITRTQGQKTLSKHVAIGLHPTLNTEKDSAEAIFSSSVDLLTLAILELMFALS